jgi:hypothetical protein
LGGAVGQLVGGRINGALHSFPLPSRPKISAWVATEAVWVIADERRDSATSPELRWQATSLLYLSQPHPFRDLFRTTRWRRRMTPALSSPVEPCSSSRRIPPRAFSPHRNLQPSATSACFPPGLRRRAPRLRGDTPLSTIACPDGSSCLAPASCLVPAASCGRP